MTKKPAKRVLSKAGKHFSRKPAKALPSRKIVVTGAAGRLGRKLVLELMRKGYCCTAIVRDEQQAWDLRKHAYDALGEVYFQNKHRFEIAINDLSSYDELVPLFFGASDVVHLAASIDYHAPLSRMIARNVVPTRQVALACKIVQSRVILVSSTSVSRAESKRPITEADAPHPINAYGKSKVMAEDAVRESGPAHVIVRFPIIYGEGFTEGFSHVAKLARSGKLSIIGPGDNKISFINASDAVSALLSVISKQSVREGTFYFVGENLSQKRALEIACLAAGIAPPTRHTAKWFAVGALSLRNAALKLLGKRSSLSVENILTLCENREFDCSKAKATFGWAPKVKLGKESLKPYI